ncbi:MAG TPA: potassium-transporting ATPase subunit KdpA [Steroidobacteraceae bacterium]|jgi:K+-transporting ATPase ATPase A chain|nr:potassium-transporting ATPase subunit KdpA [Steroidobacteraceae bacterium]
MSANGWLQLAIYVIVLLLLIRPLGTYMADIFDGRGAVMRIGGVLERTLYRLCRIDPRAQMSWKQYALALLAFNLLGALALYALQRLQGYLPWNPQHMSAVSPDSSFNTAISFVTNTNWQGYVGESTMSYLTQMAGLAVQNFLSAATGIAVLVALIRGFALKQARQIGNFWVDLTRSTLYVLLPLSLILAVALVGQGVVQSFRPYLSAALIDPIMVDEPVTDASGNPVRDARGNPESRRVRMDTQTIALGPAASQIAIKQLGTNGGGFFNANSAHPFEDPTPLANFLECLAILLIPAALCYSFGRMVGDTRQGWAVLAAMLVLFIPLLALTSWAEGRGNPAYPAAVAQQPSTQQAGGNMEGKETRFGIADSTLWATATTAASNGSVNSMHDSYTPLGGLIPLWLIQLGEVIFGGVGSGLYGMLIFAIIAVFIAGLMVGRTPEYLGKKLEAFEMKMASLVILIPPLLTLVGTALAVSFPAGRAGTANPGAHGFSEILYALSSVSGNNGSAFAGLSVNAPFYNTLLGIPMWVSRYGLIVPVLAIAGSLAAKKHVPAGSGTLATHTPLFVVLLAATVVIVGALAFFPALALGPVVEELRFHALGAH